MKKVAWFSTGVSSFCAALLSEPDEVLYTHIEDQHEDSMRFLHDCEKHIGPIGIMPKLLYGSVEEVIRSQRYINGVAGAPCTNLLKRLVRKQWEATQGEEEIVYVWGLDVNERGRMSNIIEANPRAKHEFPLIERMMTKQDCHGLLERMGIKRPAMYDMGYNNNNCIGCVKGGMGYWNKIRVDFPDVFAARAEIEREIGASCINGVYLDELDPGRGRMSDEVSMECGIFCELAAMDI